MANKSDLTYQAPQRFNTTEHLPLILQCGHTFCHTCLSRNTQYDKTQISCLQCQAITVISDGNAMQLPVNYFCLGYNSSLFSGGEKVYNKNFVNSKNKSYQHQLNVNKPVVKCSVCSIDSATCKCLQCDFNVCISCFDKIHNASLTLRTHQAVSLTEGVINQDSSPSVNMDNTCQEHPGKIIEYFCTTDSIECCSHCVIKGNHRGHPVLTIEEMSQDALDKLAPLVEEGTEVLKWLKRSQLLLARRKQPDQVNKQQIHHTIQITFQHLYGLMLTREASLHEEVEKLFGTEEKISSTLSKKLENEVKSLENMLSEYRRAKIPGSPAANQAQLLLSKMQNLSEIPCVLSGEFISKFDHIKVDVSEGFVDNLKNVVSLSGFSHSELELLSLRKAEADHRFPSEAELCSIPASPLTSPHVLPVSSFIPESSRRIFNEDKNKITISVSNEENALHAAGPNNFYEAERSEADVETSSVASNETDSLRNSFSTDVKRINIDSYAVEQVRVTHISNPCNFMVQRCTDLQQVRKLQKKINEFCNSPECRIPLSVEKGKVYLAQYSVDKMWYRALVTNVDPSYSIANVQYIDYGNTETISIDRIRQSKPQFLQRAGYAMKCALVDIVSPNESPSGQWPVESSEALLSMTDDKPVLLRIFRKRNDVLIVDLRRLPIDEIVTEQPVSFRDALVLLGLACFQTDDANAMQVQPMMLRKFIPPRIPDVGQQMNAILGFHKTPDDFYIHEVNFIEAYSNMLKSMHKLFNEDGGNRYKLYCPQKGLTCAAQYSSNKAWYRAVVTDVKGFSKITVLYVDYGNEETLSIDQLKWLPGEYHKLQTMAIRCGLTDVVPADGEREWSQQAINALVPLYEKPFNLSVIDITKDKKLQIVVREDDMTLNARLVVDGLAASTGAHSILDVPFSLKRNKRSNHTPEYSELEKFEITQKQEQQILNTSNTITSSPQQRMEVIISHFINPGKFYVQRINLLPDLNEFQKGLMDAYKNLDPPSGTNWAEGNVCIVRYSKDKEYYRAEIIKIHADQKRAQVCLLDYGFEDEAELSQLHVIHEKFINIRRFAMEFQLADLQPAGGTDKWPQTACNVFQEHVFEEGIRILLVPKEEEGETRKNCVDLVLERLIAGGALTPERREYTSMISIMRERGVALPTRRIPSARGKQQLPIVRTSDFSTPLTDYLPAAVPEDNIFEAVPTYVHRKGYILMQPVSSANAEHGRVGQLLRETTLEVIIQNRHLSAMGLHRARIPRDGNCLYRACAQMVFFDQEKHRDVRQAAADIIEKNFDLFANSIPDEEKDAYVSKMLVDGTYGGDIEIKAISCAFNAQICVYLGGLNYPLQQKLYGPNKPTQTICLIYISDGDYDQGHYDLIVADKDVADIVNNSYLKWRNEHIKQLGDVSWKNMARYDDSLLHRMMDFIQQKYHGTAPEEYGYPWKIGQPVVAYYPDDDKFYRAKIVSEDSRGYEVYYVDFGNSEYLQSDKLRMPAALLDIPPQCFAANLYGFKGTEANGAWTMPALTYMHNLIVNEHCTVLVKDRFKTGDATLSVQLALPHGENVGIHLFNKKYAVYDIGEEMTSRVIVRSAPSPYLNATLPKIGDVIKVNVTYVESPEKVYLQYDASASDDLLMVLIKSQQDELLKTNSELNTFFEKFPPVSPYEIKPGLACCGLFSEDARWYRAEVIFADYSRQIAKILFVDYGNSDVVQFECIRILPGKYKDLPCQAITAKLAYIGPARDSWQDGINEALFKLFEEGLPLTAHVVDIDSSSSAISVEIFNGNNLNTSMLSYRTLIDTGYIVYKRPALASQSPVKSTTPVVMKSSSNSSLSQRSNSGSEKGSSPAADRIKTASPQTNACRLVPESHGPKRVAAQFGNNLTNFVRVDGQMIIATGDESEEENFT